MERDRSELLNFLKEYNTFLDIKKMITPKMIEELKDFEEKMPQWEKDHHRERAEFCRIENEKQHKKWNIMLEKEIKLNEEEYRKDEYETKY